MWISLKLFLDLYLNGSLIPRTFAVFDRLFELSSSARATASKKTAQNIVMATVEFSLENTE